MSNAEMAAALPDPGAGRWWKVELVKNVQKNPIKITLMEEAVAGRRALSTALAFGRTIAAPSKVAEAADMVLAQVGEYAKVIGEYPLAPSAERVARDPRGVSAMPDLPKSAGGLHRMREVNA